MIHIILCTKNTTKRSVVGLADQSLPWRFGSLQEGRWSWLRGEEVFFSLGLRWSRCGNACDSCVGLAIRNLLRKLMDTRLTWKDCVYKRAKSHCAGRANNAVDRCPLLTGCMRFTQERTLWINCERTVMRPLREQRRKTKEGSLPIFRTAHRATDGYRHW